MTKSEAKQLGWDGGRIPGWTSQNKLSIGGDVFYNLEQLLPKNTTYQECDIDYNGASNRDQEDLSGQGILRFTIHLIIIQVL